MGEVWELPDQVLILKRMGRPEMLKSLSSAPGRQSRVLRVARTQKVLACCIPAWSPAPLPLASWLVKSAPQLLGLGSGLWRCNDVATQALLHLASVTLQRS